MRVMIIKFNDDTEKSFIMMRHIKRFYITYAYIHITRIIHVRTCIYTVDGNLHRYTELRPLYLFCSKCSSGCILRVKYVYLCSDRMGEWAAQ